jgi:hypothetical protein
MLTGFKAGPPLLSSTSRTFLTSTSAASEAVEAQAAPAPLRPKNRFLFGQPNLAGPAARSALTASNVKSTAVLSSGAEVDTRYFSCVWGKKSNRKHKKWEGDAYMKEMAGNKRLLSTQCIGLRFLNKLFSLRVSLRDLSRFLKGQSTGFFDQLFFTSQLHLGT